MNEVVLKASNNKYCYQNLSEKYGINFKILNVMPSFSKTVGATLLLEFFTDGDVIEQILADIKSFDYVFFAEVQKNNSDSHLVLVKSTYSFPCSVLTKSGCFINKVEFTPTGMYIKLLVGTNCPFHELIQEFKDNGFEVEVIKKQSADLRDDLTPRQRKVLTAAFEMGFFDVPKRITLKELSEKVGVSASSADEIIKRAENKIISRYFMV
ncbi:MAG: helix-turn-helix domain-containing protein [Candidatus Methanofastidiosia archaeon]